MKAFLVSVVAVVVLSVVLVGQAVIASDFESEQTRLLNEAEAALAANPADPMARIWVGRRLGYLGRYEDAIAVFETGEAEHPADARFARHIGHRLISLKKYPEAEAAFERAAKLTAAMPDQVEPDGLPNEAGIPTSTLKGNIWYHLGLARYLQGNFSGAAMAYEGAAALAHNPDAAAAALYWLYLSQMHAGDTGSAEKTLGMVEANWVLIENGVYHELALCLRGDFDCDAILSSAQSSEGIEYATPAYGIAMARLLAGDKDGAKALLQDIADSDTGASFGRLAAQADLARLK